jgi:hypothetical protein
MDLIDKVISYGILCRSLLFIASVQVIHHCLRPFGLWSNTDGPSTSNMTSN